MFDRLKQDRQSFVSQRKKNKNSWLPKNKWKEIRQEFAKKTILDPIIS